MVCDHKNTYNTIRIHITLGTVQSFTKLGWAIPFSACKGFSFEKSVVPNYPWKFHREAKIAKFGIETFVKQNVGSGCRTVSNETWIDINYREVMYI